MGAHESHCVASAQPWRAVVLHRLVSALRVEVSHGDSACVQLWATALPRSCARSISNLRMTSPFGTHRGRLPATLAAALPPLDCWQGATKPPPFHAWGGHPARARCLDLCAQTTAAVHAALRTTRRSAAAALKKADAECLLAVCAGQLRPALPRSESLCKGMATTPPHRIPASVEGLYVRRLSNTSACFSSMPVFDAFDLVEAADIGRRRRMFFEAPCPYANRMPCCCSSRSSRF